MAYLIFSASDWYNQIPISLFETPKLDMLMIYGFPKPWNPVLIHFVIPKCFTKYKLYGNILENIIFVNMDIKTFENVRRSVYSCFCNKIIYFILYLTKMRIGNDIFHKKNISKSLDMIFISIKNMKWKDGNMYQISFEIIKYF